MDTQDGDPRCFRTVDKKPQKTPTEIAAHVVTLHTRCARINEQLCVAVLSSTGGASFDIEYKSGAGSGYELWVRLHLQ